MIAVRSPSVDFTLADAVTLADRQAAWSSGKPRRTVVQFVVGVPGGRDLRRTGGSHPADLAALALDLPPTHGGTAHTGGAAQAGPWPGRRRLPSAAAGRKGCRLASEPGARERAAVLEWAASGPGVAAGCPDPVGWSRPPPTPPADRTRSTPSFGIHSTDVEHRNGPPHLDMQPSGCLTGTGNQKVA